MPVTPREISERGYYHLILRGNSKQIIFEDRADYIHFLNNLKQYSEEHKIAVNAYCLMENHVHLLVCAGDQDISMFMKRLAGNYALWFNRKYQRTGHLFESRYTSKAIHSDNYLCTVFRYILNNPSDNNICPAADYPWSSYHSYGNPKSFVDTKILMEFIGSFKEYEAFLNSKNEDDEIGAFISKRDDEWAKSVIKKTLSIESGTKLQTYDMKTRNEAIRQLKEKGLSIRQMERLTGISKGAIQRALSATSAAAEQR